MAKVTDFHKQPDDSRPQVLQHGLAEALQVLQVWLPLHNAAPLTRVTMTGRQFKKYIYFS